MLRIIHPNGTIIELSDAQAQQVYTVSALADRLRMSERTAYELVRSGGIDYCCAGQKGYRVGEPAVQRFLLGLPPLAT